MNLSKMKKHAIFFGGLYVLMSIFCVSSFIYFLTAQQTLRALMCLGTILLVLLPEGFEKMTQTKLSFALKLFIVLYAIGPMLGHAFKWYYTFPIWDSVLHFSGGFVFGVVGLFLFTRINGKAPARKMTKMVFALMFSISIAVLWEFFEYGIDCLFVMDMQQDTVLTEINSYLLGDVLGELKSFRDIQSVTINGEVISTNGYVDIGLIDTMTDMLVECLGGLVFFIVGLVSQNENPFFKWNIESKNDA